MAVVLLGATAAASSTASATTLTDVTLRDVADASSAIVIARVGAQRTVRAAQGAPTRWETHSELEVERYVRGRGPSALVLRQLGRWTQGVDERIVSDARLQSGQRVLLFLRAPQAGVIHLTLLGYGAYELRDVRGGTAAVPFANEDHSAGAQAAPVLGAPTTLAALEHFLRASR